jgi:hypothetical protein
MPWWDGLSPEIRRELDARYPSLSFDEIALRVMSDLPTATSSSGCG